MIDVAQAQSDGTAIIRDLPHAVGVPCFMLFNKACNDLHSAYITNSGSLVVNGALSASTRYYCAVVYRCNDATRFL